MEESSVVPVANLPQSDDDVKQEWEKEQLELKKRLVISDDFDWPLPAGATAQQGCNSPTPSASSSELRYVAGVDISFIKNDPVNACAALVVLSFPDLQVVWGVEKMVKLDLPYVPGFLAFREVPHLLPLFEQLRAEKPQLWPQLVFVDGNGVLHPRGFGLASHLGVLTDIPTIGVGKTFIVDGLDMREVKSKAVAACKKGGDWIPLVGDSGAEWGAAFRSTNDSSNPIYVSVGHKTSLQSAVLLTQVCCIHRVPEPIRQADQRSRTFLRNLGS